MKNFVIITAILVTLTGCDSTYDGKNAQTWAEDYKMLSSSSEISDNTITRLTDKLKQTESELADANKKLTSYKDVILKGMGPSNEELIKQTDVLVNCINKEWDDSLTALQQSLSQRSDSTPQFIAESRNLALSRCSYSFLNKFGAVKMTTLGEACNENPNYSPDC